MHFKQALGLIFLSFGFILVLYALNAMGYLPNQYPKQTQVTSSPLSPSEHMPVQLCQKESGSPSYPVLILIGGIVMVVSGGWIAIHYKK